MSLDPREHQITVTEVAEKMQKGEPLRLIDIRGPQFREIANIEGSEDATEELIEELLTLPKDTEIVFHCHVGVSSLDITGYFLEQGFTNAKNMAGGIAAWSAEVDPDVPRY